MFHKGRTHNVAEIATAEELAKKLTETVWTLCTGFRHAGYLYLNDSSSEDGAAEYAIYKDGDPTGQIESITFGWCSEAEALKYIQEITAGKYDDARWETPAVKFTVGVPHTCSRCA